MIQKTTHIISLFCGAGGLDWGFHKAGFNISLALDISEAAILSYKENFKKTASYEKDINEIGGPGVVELAKRLIPQGDSLGIIGGPPCQGFSIANVMSKQNDPRNKLPFKFLEIIKCLKEHYIVDFVIFENVLGLKNRKHISTYLSILDGFKKMGFNISEQELCALDFGVPQNRRRIIIIALKEGIDRFKILPFNKRGKKTVRQAIGHLDSPVFFQKGLKAKDIPFHPNHWTMRPRSQRFSNPESMKASSRSFRRLVWDKASPTIAFGNREIHVHPTGTRRLSVYEAMLLQGFPKNFVLKGNFSQQVEQISNAVPPPLAFSVAEAVKKSLKEAKYGSF